jgi:hypothetical protein
MVLALAHRGFVVTTNVEMDGKQRASSSHVKEK